MNEDKLKEYLNTRKEKLQRYYSDTNVYDGAVISYGGLKEINMLLKWLEQKSTPKKKNLVFTRKNHANTRKIEMFK